MIKAADYRWCNSFEVEKIGVFCGLVDALRTGIPAIKNLNAAGTSRLPRFGLREETLRKVLFQPSAGTIELAVINYSSSDGSPINPCQRLFDKILPVLTASAATNATPFTSKCYPAGRHNPSTQMKRSPESAWRGIAWLGN